MPLKLSEKHIQRVVDILDTSIEHFVSLMVENNPTTIRSRPKCHLYCFIKEDVVSGETDVEMYE
jgi:hypothetical protein